MDNIFKNLCILILCFSIILVLTSFKKKVQTTGIVKISWYGSNHHGKKTASGKKFNMNALTAAHKELKFGTKVKITNLKNYKSVVVTINDRGPYVGSRKFDLSKAAFKEIANLNNGIITVKYEILN